MPKGRSEEHSFWCLQCGKQGIPLSRPSSHKRERFHRKKLYCPNCRYVVNHIECKDQFEVNDFKMLFADGYFQEEAIMSIKECAEIG